MYCWKTDKSYSVRRRGGRQRIKFKKTRTYLSPSLPMLNLWSPFPLSTSPQIRPLFLVVTSKQVLIRGVSSVPIVLRDEQKHVMIFWALDVSKKVSEGVLAMESRRRKERLFPTNRRGREWKLSETVERRIPVCYKTRNAHFGKFEVQTFCHESEGVNWMRGYQAYLDATTEVPCFCLNCCNDRQNCVQLCTMIAVCGRELEISMTITLEEAASDEVWKKSTGGNLWHLFGPKTTKVSSNSGHQIWKQGVTSDVDLMSKTQGVPRSQQVVNKYVWILEDRMTSSFSFFATSAM